uniref:SWIM zinc finger family protein n=1 Tax=Ningiella ruwaisensis TaxID=2364274 RepID=UPI0010A06789|nr:hypothetical protein [Ningiella ruwaisensis]
MRKPFTENVDLEAIHLLAERLAGQNAYEKGVSLYHSGAVTDLSIDENQVNASVHGSKLYRVKLTFLESTIDGGCSCPASEGFDFCKHCVATSLAYQERLKHHQKLIDGEPSQRLRAYIDSLNENEIKAELLSIIESDSELLSDYILLADVSSGKLQSSDLKKHITKALPLRDIWRHERVRDYFEQAKHKLRKLFNIIERLDPRSRYELCQYALLRYDKILERVDDSGGYRFSLFALLQRQYAETIKKLDISTDEMVELLLALFVTDYEFIEFENISDTFIDKSNRQLTEKFYQRLKQTIDQKLDNASKSSNVETLVLKKMTRELIRYYEANQMQKHALAYTIHFASDIDAFFKVIDLALNTNELAVADEYIRAASQQVRMPNDKLKLAKYALESAKANKNYSKALDDAWEIFEQSLSVEDFQQLIEISRKLEIDEKEICKRAERYLLKVIANLSGTSAKSSGLIKAVENTIEFFLFNKQYDKALAMANEYDVPPDTIHEVAYECLAHKPKASFNLYRQLCLLYPQLGSQKDYLLCIEILQELNSNLPDSPEFNQRFSHLLAELADIFRLKPGFIELLNQHFAQIR